jgi:hypothetical protein
MAFSESVLSLSYKASLSLDPTVNKTMHSSNDIMCVGDI